MSVVWPGALRWTSSVVTSRPIRCSTRPKLDNLFSRIVRTTQKSYLSPSRFIQPSLVTRSSRPICPLTPQNTLTFPIRTVANQKATPYPIITEYKDLPEDYKDEQGLDFRKHPLSQEEVTQWFGPAVNVDFANTVLRKLHGRRVAGTLDDPAHAGHNDIEKKMTQDALAWLRKNVPVDEIQNAGLRADYELAAMGEEPVRESEEVIYKPNYDPAQSLAQPKSSIDKIRQFNEARIAQLEEEEKARQKQAEEIQQVSGDVVVNDLKSNVVLRKPGEHPWLKYYQEQANAVVPDKPPTMTKTARLLPSGIVVLATILGSVLYAATYVPPTHRLWTDTPPSGATIGGIIIINLCVLLAWRIPPLWRFLNKYMLVVPLYPRAASMVGNMFSHQEFTHIAPNMLVLWIIGTRLGDQIGRGDFIALYLSAGVVGSFVSMSSYVLRGILMTQHLGASGAVLGILAAWAWINKDQKLEWIFFPEGMLSPLPEYSSMVILGVMVLRELFVLRRLSQLVKARQQTSDAIHHLAGITTGLIGGEIVRRRMIARQKEKRGVLMMKKRDALGREL